MHRRRQQRRKPMAEINIVPYVDVMLVLLVIFMITAPLLTAGVDVQLPEAKARAIPHSEQQPLVLTVNAKGKLFLNIADNPHKAMDTESLLLRLSAELQRNRRSVLVRGDKAVAYGEVVKAMVIAQQAGANSVGLVTDSTNDKT